MIDFIARLSSAEYFFIMRYNYAIPVIPGYKSTNDLLFANYTCALFEKIRV
jgi:hypothetical protein